MTTKALRKALAEDRVNAAVLATTIAKALATAAGYKPDAPISAKNRSGRWTTFYNDAHRMVLDLESYLAIRAKETPLFKQVVWSPAEHDNCSICLGDNGGVLGNENIVDGIVMCDDCHAEQIEARNGE